MKTTNAVLFISQSTRSLRFYYKMLLLESLMTSKEADAPCQRACVVVLRS